MTGKQNSTKQANSRLSENDRGLLLTGIAALGLDPGEETRLAALLQEIGQTPPAEELVPGWMPRPALLSDKDCTFGAGDEIYTVKLKILGMEYYVSEFLPWFEETATALYGAQTMAALMESITDPIGFILDVIREVAKRPQGDRLKVSFYEFAAQTFSNKHVTLEPEFLAICPPDQLQSGVKQLVAINRANFTNLWAEMPTLPKLQLTLLYQSFIEAVVKTRENLSLYISRVAMELQEALQSNGGLANIGTDGSTASPVVTLE